jgi:hypothetical protein
MRHRHDKLEIYIQVEVRILVFHSHITLCLSLMTENIHPDLVGTGLCADCLTGFSFAGTPRGRVIKVGSFETVYVTSEEEPSGKPAIVMFTDVFGLGVCLIFFV